MGIVTGILLLSLLMIIHELGHYITGRIFKFKIIEFSVFMGPVLLSKTSKKTGIKYSLKLFPIGASVRFEGEEGMGEKASDAKGSFNSMSIPKRAAVIFNGPLVNILAGALALFILFSFVGHTTLYVDEIAQGSQATETSLSKGDKILAVNDFALLTSMDYEFMYSTMAEDKPAMVKFKDIETGEIITQTLTPKKIKRHVLGITLNKTELNSGYPLISISKKEGFNDSLEVGDIIVKVNNIPFVDEYEKASAEIAGSEGKDINLEIIRDGKAQNIIVRAFVSEYYSQRGIYFSNDKSLLNSAKQSLLYTVSVSRVTIRSIGMMISGKIAAKDSLSGPVGVVSFVGSVVEQGRDIVSILTTLLFLFAIISINLGVFNLLPIPALDGSHLILLIVEAIRGKRLSDKVQGAIVATGFALIIVLALMGLFFDILRLTGRS